MHRGNAGKRLLVLVVVALGVLAAGVGTAYAVEAVLIRPGGAMTMRGTIRDRPLIECNVTLSGSYESRTIPLTGEGLTIGSVTGLSSECANLSEIAYRIEPVLRLPWTIRLRKLSGWNPVYAPAEILSYATFQIPGVAFQLRPYERFGLLPTCLYGTGTETIEHTPGLIRVREFGSEYTVGADSGTFQLRTTSGGECTEEFYRAQTFSFTLAAPSPTQTFNFSPGGEVIEGLTPRLVEFGRLATEALARRTVTISSTGGARIESIEVSSGRYFAVTDPNACKGSVLAEGGRCVINVLVATPAEAGRALSDTLFVTVSGFRYQATLRAST